MSQRSRQRARKLRAAAPGSGPAPSRQPPVWVAALALTLLGLAAYQNSFTGAFIFDDNARIVDNEAVRKLWPLAESIFSPAEITRPIVTLSLILNFKLGALHVAGYHVFNFCVHLLAGLVLFGVVRRTLGSPRLHAHFGPHASWLALAATGLWLVHPLQTQAVTYVIQRAEALMALFFLLTLYCLIRGAQGRFAWVWYGGAAVACLLGAGCKQVIAAVPLVALLYDRTFLAGSFAAALRRRWPLYLALAGSWLILALLLSFSEQERSVGLELGFTPWQYLLNQGNVILHYLGLSLWPAALCVDYGWEVQTSLWKLLPGLAGISALLGLSVWALVRYPAWGFVGAAFFLILAPTSSFLPIKDLAVEHRMYLPLALLTSALAAGAYLLCRHRNKPPALLFPAAALVLLALTVRTVMRNGDYQSNAALWRQTVSVRPEYPRAVFFLAAACADAGDRPGAIKYYRRVLELDEKFPEAHHNLAVALLDQNLTEEAAQHLVRALELKPTYAQAYFNLGHALIRLGDYAGAAENYEAALKFASNTIGALDPAAGLTVSFDDLWRAQILGQLGLACLNLRRFEDAAAKLEQSVRLFPGAAPVWQHWGVALMHLGQPEAAVARYRQALKVRPDYPEAENNLGVGLVRAGKASEAVQVLSALLQRRPDLPQAHFNLGLALEDTGNPAAARKHFEIALRLDPHNAAARSRLENLKQQMRDHNHATGE